MGMFEVKVELANLAAPGRAEEVSLLVDTGATLSWIPREVLQKLGVTAFSKLPFSLADGCVLERDTTAVILTIDGRKAPVPVALGEPGEEAVLGATALEVLGFVVDPVAKKLIRAEPPRSANSSLRGFEDLIAGVDLLVGTTYVEQLGLLLHIVCTAEWCTCLRPNQG